MDKVTSFFWECTCVTTNSTSEETFACIVRTVFGMRCTTMGELSARVMFPSQAKSVIINFKGFNPLPNGKV